MTKILKIDIVSDVSCPWCVIGYHSLSQALEKMEPQVTAIISWKPFELNPKMPPEGQDMGEHLHQKYGSTPADTERVEGLITERGKALGFQFNFTKGSRIYNTFNAHRLLHWAASLDKQTELSQALFGLYFTDRGNPSDKDALLKTAEKVGLPLDEAKKLLESDQFAKEVREEEAKFLAQEINSVPTFIINDHFKITGGQSVETFVEMLSKIHTEEKSTHI